MKYIKSFRHILYNLLLDPPNFLKNLLKIQLIYEYFYNWSGRVLRFKSC